MLAYPLRSWLNRGIVDDSEFEFGERLPADTRIEVLHAQAIDMLNAPIPFANRVEFLSDYIKPDAHPRTIEKIAGNLHIKPHEVKRMAAAVGAKTIMGINGRVAYETFTQEVIEEEMGWAALLESLDEAVPIATIAYHLGRSVSWVNTRLIILDIYPKLETRNFQNGKNFELEVYPKESIVMLRTYALHFPPANDWYSPSEAEQAVGKSKEWIDVRIISHGLTTQLRALAVNQRLATHYPQETIDALKKIAAEIPPAGDWMTEHHMIELLSGRRTWVHEQLDSLREFGELRLTDSGAVNMHYPAFIFEKLKDMYNNLPPSADGWKTAWALAKEINKDVDWVMTRIKAYIETAEMRLTRTGRAELHYPLEVCEQIRLLSLEYPLAGEWMTENGMAVALGRTPKWVRIRIEAYLSLGEMRLSRVNNRPRIHYPPEVFQALKDLVFYSTLKKRW